MSLASRVHDTLDLISPHDCSELRNELNALLTAENYMALEARCIREFGLAAGVLARQLVYWEGKGYDPNGWTYKTKAELREEVGLSSAMVDTAQRRLEDRGVLRTDRRPKRRPDGRIKHPSPVIHYQLDLLKLAQVLGIFDDGTTLNHESKPQEFITFNRANSHPSTTRNAAFHTHREPPKTQPESLPLQDGGDGPSDRPAPPTNRSGPSLEEEHLDNEALTRGVTPPREAAMEVEALTGHLQPLPFKVVAPTPQLEAETKNRAWWILTGGEGENDVTRSADRYLDSGADANGGPFTVERVARKLQEHIGGHEPEAFVPLVKRCLEHMRVEQEVAEKIG